MKKTAAIFTLILTCAISIFAQDEFKTRHMLKKPVFFVNGTGVVETAEYWSLSLGNFDVAVEREFPGEGILAVEGSVNLNYLSSGYIEGNGYGEKGKMIVNADFAIDSAGTLVSVKETDIDYVFLSGTKIALKNGQPQDLFLKIESPKNKVQAVGTSIKIFAIDKEFGELKFKKDVERIVGFSFTKEGALRAYKAALAANE